MDYDLAVTKQICANIGPRNKKQFLNPPIDNMPKQKKMAGKPLACYNNQV